MLASRLEGRLRHLGFTSFGAYHAYVFSGREDELSKMVDAVCTSETSFFRDPEQLSYLEKMVIVPWMLDAARGRRSRRIRAWSAGCASGEEAYSIAALLLSRFPTEGATGGHPLARTLPISVLDRSYQVEVLGTDVAPAALEKARAGMWPVAAAEDIPSRLRSRYFTPDSANGTLRANEELRRVVRFHRLNLTTPEYPTTGRFDIILCRNVLSYFEPDAQERTLSRLTERLAPGGVLLLGMGETLPPTPPNAKLVRVGPSMYAPAGTVVRRQSGVLRVAREELKTGT